MYDYAKGGPFPLQYYLDASITTPPPEDLIPAAKFPDLHPHTEEELLALGRPTIQQLITYWRTIEEHLIAENNAFRTAEQLIDTLEDIGFNEIDYWHRHMDYSSPACPEAFRTHRGTFRYCPYCYFGRHTGDDKSTGYSCRAWYDPSAAANRPFDAPCIFHGHTTSALRASYHIFRARHDEVAIKLHTAHAYIAYLQGLLFPRLRV